MLTAGVAALLLFSMPMTGCRARRIGGTVPPDTVILQLRRDNEALRQQVAELEKKMERGHPVGCARAGRRA